MKLTFLTDFCKRTGSMDFCVSRLAAIGSGVTLVLVATALWGGYQLGQFYGESPEAYDRLLRLQGQLEQERGLVADAKAEQRAHLDALALRIAELQAHMMRLDALGDRLVDVGNLDRQEFDFTVQPPLGGAEEGAGGETLMPAELSEEMSRISAMLADREDKLAVLEQMLMNREIVAETTPSGRPVSKGWMSSGFGKRTDPFKGKKAFHRGVDFAGARGSEVMAVASGIVIRSEHNSGYGNVVEVRHADGYSTLYAHNKENLVEEGDMVSKGQTIALLGSTGRSSGPHVHFEVHHNGKIINPNRFLGSN